MIEVHEIPVVDKNGQNPATENPASAYPTQDINNISRTTDISDSINLSGQEAYDKIRDEVAERICYDTLVHDYPDQIDTIDLIIEILITIGSTDQKTMRIGKEEKPIAVVRSQMKKLTMFHIQYVLGGLESAGRIKNPTAYLMTSLYRSVFTMQMHIANHVDNDMYRMGGSDEQ